MKILVCISNVPDTTTKISFADDNTKFNTAGVQYIINPSDEIALARAIELAGEPNVTVLNVGTAGADPTLRKALAIGAGKAVRIDTEPTDAYTVAKQIAEYAANEGYDVIMTGHESIDYNGSQVPAMVAELLNIPSVSIIKKIDVNGNTATVEREIEGGKEVLDVNMPLVVSCAEGVAEAKIPNMRGIMAARSKPLEVKTAVNAEAATAIKSYESLPPRGTVTLVNSANELVEMLNKKAKVI